uniref:Uncharacterized protein n=1 Tax=Anguilla anguilla TaxID=7936 RepID=A0A0E9PC66_ANGAN
MRERSREGGKEREIGSDEQDYPSNHVCILDIP